MKSLSDPLRSALRTSKRHIGGGPFAGLGEQDKWHRAGGSDQRRDGDGDRKRDAWAQQCVLGGIFREGFALPK